MNLVQKEIERVWPYLPGALVSTRVAGRMLTRRFVTPRGLSDYVERTAGPGVDHYVHINETSCDDRKASIGDVVSWRHVFIDIDPLSVGSFDIEGARATVCQYLFQLGYFPATLGIDSGRGSQLWLAVGGDVLESGVSSRAVEAAMGNFLRSIPCSHGCTIDACTSDLPRIARLPGSLNSKTGRMARVVFEPTGALAATEFLSKWGVSDSPPGEPMQPALDGSWSKRKALGRISTKAGTYLAYGWEHPGRRAAVVATAASLAEAGVPSAVAFEWVQDANARSSPIPLGQFDLRRAFDNGWERGLRNASTKQDQA